MAHTLNFQVKKHLSLFIVLALRHCDLEKTLLFYFLPKGTDILFLSTLIKDIKNNVKENHLGFTMPKMTKGNRD